VLAGNHRLLAARIAGLAEVPCIVMKAGQKEDALFVETFCDNAIRQDYSPLEKANAVCHLAAMAKISHAEAGKRLGIGAPEVSKLMRVLHGFPQDLLPLIGEGMSKIPITSAYLMSRLPDEATIRQMADKVMHGMSRQEVEAEVARCLGGKQPKPKAVKVQVAGMAVEFSVTDVAKARTLLAQIDAGLVKLEKHSLPLSTLSQMLKNPPQG